MFTRSSLLLTSGHLALPPTTGECGLSLLLATLPRESGNTNLSVPHFPYRSRDLPFCQRLHHKPVNAGCFCRISIHEMAEADAEDGEHIRTKSNNVFCRSSPVNSVMVWWV